IFIDGGSKGVDVTSVAPSGWDHLTIGTTADNTPVDYMDGEIALPAIWNCALTDSEVRLLPYVSPWKIRPHNIVGYYLLDIRTLDRDMSGHGHHLTPVNSPTWTPDPPVLQKRYAEEDRQKWYQIPFAPTTAAKILPSPLVGMDQVPTTAREFAAASNQYTRSSSVPSITFPFTMACWTQATVDTNTAIFGIGDSAGGVNRDQYLLWRHGSLDRFSIMRGDGGVTDYLYGPNNAVPINEWHHICAVFHAADDV
ncbi:unnamed protein product, partial [marine sediment metagenome]